MASQKARFSAGQTVRFSYNGREIDPELEKLSGQEAQIVRELGATYPLDRRRPRMYRLRFSVTGSADRDAFEDELQLVK
jgi:hypothetical protein